MPFPLLAHQAPVLPLKARWPGAFNRTALVVGSMAPDLQNLSSGPNAGGTVASGHTLLGQLTFCLPVTMAVVLAIGHLRLGEVLAARFGKRLAWLMDAATDVTSPGGLRRAVTSALFGSFSHLAFDALTHETGARGPRAPYHVMSLTFSMHAVAQAVATLLGALVSVWLLRRMYLQNTREAPQRRAGAAPLVLLGVAGGAFGFTRALPALRHPTWYFEAAPIYVAGFTLFVVVVGAAAAILVGAALLALLDRRRAQRSREAPRAS